MTVSLTWKADADIESGISHFNIYKDNQLVSRFPSAGSYQQFDTNGDDAYPYGVVRGLRMTSYPSLKTDLVNAGAHWVDEEVVVDRGIVSSRKPADIPAFTTAMIEEFGEGHHGGAGTRQQARTHA